MFCLTHAENGLSKKEIVYDIEFQITHVEFKYQTNLNHNFYICLLQYRKVTFDVNLTLTQAHILTKGAQSFDHVKGKTVVSSI